MLGLLIRPGAMHHPVVAAAEPIQLVHQAAVLIGPPALQAAVEQWLIAAPRLPAAAAVLIGPPALQAAVEQWLIAAPRLPAAAVVTIGPPALQAAATTLQVVHQAVGSKD